MEDEPPDFTIVVYKSLFRQYFPMVIGNNGQIDEKLKNFSNPEDIIGTYKVKEKYSINFCDLCKSSFGKSEGIVKNRIEKFLVMKKDN